MLKLDFSPVLLQDEHNDFDSNLFFIFESQNASETIPDKLVVHSVCMNALLELSVVLEENILSHSSLV